MRVFGHAGFSCISYLCKKFGSSTQAHLVFLVVFRQDARKFNAEKF